ncbi:RNA polymerase sigma factor SigJ [Sulfitobacter sp. M57]|uniref:RNA polymerase sigma factor SigJ n=1 Tax=unclassified Sulfitobacter TaxID=196795 RepID=UPI0023E2DE7E|nr:MULTISPECIES: RNA polymerase sigma factor SigJ [unclassified Sulfitobacter]MDF3415860.1 RNA polymerase sigma factor SigJ [Sulfitobacter sp. KE5]MDF3423340.1 RNA polymerase sigma factor SigJ [Sulfitobacter sp. KE43]MDF3434406.1 RNA polymerase sigma factor SigJ [Sulfitobacter sp. KE42]MDF3460046.1 RNA polymerase sigma factor SigJ [Sulfitobacter sp. S74]MDF3463944.1 RNA polymerase sigma factor SigJ [Sulfitobacter sp. Ks18]
MNIAIDIFEGQRPILISLCYRMLGERAAAEDAVQDTWLKWARVDAGQIDNPTAWLRRVATNIAIDTLRSARRQREVYVGPWLPEPLMQSELQEPVHPFELAQECELALLWAMERLTERERAAFILREAFDASYCDIAATLGTSEAACRQLVSRSQKKLQDTGPRFDATPEEVADLSQRFFMAIMAEDFDAALSLLTPNSVAISDGGAKRRAARRPLIGDSEILQVFRALHEKARAEAGWTNGIAVVNTKPALLRYHRGALDSITTLAPDQNGKIAWFYIMRNPDKLGLVEH